MLIADRLVDAKGRSCLHMLDLIANITMLTDMLIRLQITLVLPLAWISLQFPRSKFSIPLNNATKRTCSI